MKRVNSESNTKQCLSIAESCASSTTVKKTNINIDDIKRYPTVTNPIKADDLSTPQAYAYSLRRAIVTDCTPEQRAELVELLNGKDTAEGVTFNNTKANRNSLHRWQNEQSRKERAAILGEGWQYVEGLNHGTQPGDLVTCVGGTRGRVTKSNPESCVIEFETENGQRLTVAGYFRYTPSEKSEAITEAEGIQIGDTVRHNKHEEIATVTAIREAFVNRCDGHRYLYTLDFGQSVKGPFGVELNGGEFLREAFTPCTPDTISTEDEEAGTDPRFTLNRYNISPIAKYINDLGTIYANIRPEDDPEGKRLGYCRYVTKKPGGEWTENRCMSWHSLEYSLYVFNARKMTSAESVEDRDEMEKPTDINCLAANIDRLLKRIASRGTAFAEVLSYIECYPDMSREYLNAMQCRDSLDHFRRWCAARQKQLRRKSA